MKNIAIFASGTGTNAAAIIEYFHNSSVVKVALVVSNNPQAGVIQIAHRNKIISAIITNEALAESDLLMRLLTALDVQWIVLAGFLQLVPDYLLQAFPRRIINIHPALLPAYGGKGMFGARVHAAVIANKEAETGITIHYVDSDYDAGEVIVQKKIATMPGDTAELLANRVRELEHYWYPRTIEQLLS
jgi:phosphoribosylglycinamide formyltransferase-1